MKQKIQNLITELKQEIEEINKQADVLAEKLKTTRIYSDRHADIVLEATKHITRIEQITYAIKLLESVLAENQGEKQEILE